MYEYRRIQAHKAGQKACREGKARTVCNRQRGTIFYDDWQDGYDHVENQIPLSQGSSNVIR